VRARTEIVPSTAASNESPHLRKISYLSPPAEVSMSDQWFDIADLNHFWIQRRFEVLQRLKGTLISETVEMAEVGCGHGLLQRQIEDAYGKTVTGFDLNDYALNRNVSRRSKLYCYDISSDDEAMKERYDIIFLFDVLEHVVEEDRFLEALRFHLAPGGRLIVNVPAGLWAYSSYDRAVGHIRRYSIATLRAVAKRNDLEFDAWSYWGMPLLPVLLLRKLWLMGWRDQRKIVSTGIDARSESMNELLTKISRWEAIPQKLLGTSLMAVLRKKPVG